MEENDLELDTNDEIEGGPQKYNGKTDTYIDCNADNEPDIDAGLTFFSCEGSPRQLVRDVGGEINPLTECIEYGKLRLSGRELEAFEYVFEKCFSVHKTARIMGVTKSNVQTYLDRIREKMK
jgi:hypothetical protein